MIDKPSFTDKYIVEIICGSAILGVIGGFAIVLYFGILPSPPSFTQECLISHFGKVVNYNANNRITYKEPREICDVWVFISEEYPYDEEKSRKFYSYDYLQSHQEIHSSEGD